MSQFQGSNIDETISRNQNKKQQRGKLHTFYSQTIYSTVTL